MDLSLPVAPPAAPVPPLTRLPTGLAGLDTILGGGFFRGGLYLLTGDPGTGKTILSNQLAFHQVAAGWSMSPCWSKPMAGCWPTCGA